MSLLQLGFREIGRKYQRLRLKRGIKAAARAHSDALRVLGRRAAETGVTAPASAALLASLAEIKESNRQLASRLDALGEKKTALEAQGAADTSRFETLEKEVKARKDPVDAELAAQQKTASRNQRDIDATRRRLNQAQQEQQSLEQKLQKPAEPGGKAFDRTQAEAQVAALHAEQRDGEIKLTQLIEQGAVAQAEIQKLKTTLAPMQAELDQVRANARQAAEKLKQALAEVRKESERLRAEVAGLSDRRDKDFEELGGAVADAGLQAPELAPDQESVAAAAGSQAALQQQFDDSLAASNSTPKGTMLKFAALMSVSAFALAGAGYAANQAIQALNQPPPEAVDCTRMTYDVDPEKPPVEADPGGPYKVVRGEQAMLDGSKSKGICLQYTWTFSAVPKEEADKPGHSDKGSAEDQSVFEAVDQLACPEGTTGNPGARKTGPQAPTNFLCSLKVTLTVTDGNSTDSADVLVKVQPRGPKGWKTSIKKKQKEAPIPASKLVTAMLQFGQNVCALDTTGGHALHAGKSWQGEGYGVDTIADPDGPFDRWWYIGSSSLKIERKVLFNEDLGKKSALYRHNLENAHPDIEILRQSVLAHERLHGEIIFEKMEKIQQEGNDPAKIIETLSASEEKQDTLIEWTDVAIAQIEGHLYPGRGSDEYIQVHEDLKQRLSKNRNFDRAGEVLIPDTGGVYQPYPIANFAAAGENDE